MPTYSQAKKVIWDASTNDGFRILDFLPSDFIAQKNQQEMKIRLKNGSLFQLIGSDNIDCFDEKTEILTERGWVFFDELISTDKVASLEGEYLKFVKPNRIVKYFHEGEMYRVKSKCMDALVTPNHRFYVQSSKGFRKFKYISDETIRHDKILATSKWEGIDEPYFDFPKVVSEYTCGKGRHVKKEYTRRVKMRHFVSLLGIYLAEGSTFSNHKCYRTQISQIKTHTRDEIRELLNEMDINFCEHRNGFSFEDKQLFYYFKQFGLQDQKFIPQEIKNLSPEYLSKLLDWLMKGDGSGTHYFTTSKQLADDVQEIAIKLGYSAVIREKKQGNAFIKDRKINSKKTLYDISLRKSKFHYFQKHTHSYISKEKYEGFVYCVSVPSGIIKVRRNGCEYWSGNSLMGTNPNVVVFSEYALQTTDAWDFIRPILKVNKGTAIFISTPRGRNHFYELFNMAKTQPDWFVEKLTYRDTGVLTDEDIQKEIAEGMSEELAEQEYSCSFDRGIDGAFYAKLLTKMYNDERICSIYHDPYKLTHTAWDLGWDDCTAIIFFQLDNERIRIIDYEEHSNKTLTWYKDLLSQKGYRYGTHLFPHDVSHVDGLATGLTRKEILEDLQIPVTIVPRSFIVDGIEAVKVLLSSRVIINDKCTTLLKALENYHREYDEKKKIYKDKPAHNWSSHGADAMRYLAEGLRFVQSSNASTANEIEAINRYWGN